MSETRDKPARCRCGREPETNAGFVRCQSCRVEAPRELWDTLMSPRAFPACAPGPHRGGPTDVSIRDANGNTVFVTPKGMSREECVELLGWYLAAVNAPQTQPAPAASVSGASVEPSGEELERLAAVAHNAYLNACSRLGWAVKPENQVGYGLLSEDAKELDREMVRDVLRARSASVAPGSGEAK